MLRISKRVEYGLMALQHLARHNSVSTAREISAECDVSYDLVSKILQDLKRDGLIDSYHGVKGGYSLMMAPQEINLHRVVHALESDSSITECTGNSEHECSMSATCTIKGPMHQLQKTLDNAFSAITIAQLL